MLIDYLSIVKFELKICLISRLLFQYILAIPLKFLQGASSARYVSRSVCLSMRQKI